MHDGFQNITAFFFLIVVEFNISLLKQEIVVGKQREWKADEVLRQDQSGRCQYLDRDIFSDLFEHIIVFHASLDQMDVTPDRQVKEGAEETKKVMTMVEERAEARARVMMAATRLQSTSVLNGETADNSTMGRKSQERLGSTEGERVKMEERKPLESVSLVMRAGEKPNMGERFTMDRFSRKESRLVGEVEVEVDSDRGSSVDTTDDSGELY